MSTSSTIALPKHPTTAELAPTETLIHSDSKKEVGVSVDDELNHNQSNPTTEFSKERRKSEWDIVILGDIRPDVLPVNDLGVRKDVQHVYGLEELPRPLQMDQLCEKWRPYRSVSSCYLPRLDEAKGAANNKPLSASNLSQQQQQQQQLQKQQLQQHFLDSNYGILNVSLTWGQ